jgi:hypothetical protein
VSMNLILRTQTGDRRTRLAAVFATIALALGLLVAMPGAARADDCTSAMGSCGQPSCNGNQEVQDHCADRIYLHSGYVQHHPRVYLIFWGAGWNSGEAATNLAYLRDSVFSQLRGTAFNNILTLYSDADGPISNDTVRAGWDVDTQPTGQIFEGDIGAEIDREVARLGWTADDDTQFIVFPQPGTDISPLDGCGRHSLRPPGASGTEAWVAYPSDRPLCIFGGGVQASLSMTALHEYAEAATDPQGLDFSGVPTNVHGWATDEPHDNPIEVADKCSHWDPQKVDPYNADLPRLWNPSVGACTYGHGRTYVTADPGWQFHTVAGRILDEYIDLGEQNSVLGLPMSEESAIGNGRVSRFLGALCGNARYGEIYLSDATGPHEVHGCIDREYQAGIPDQPGGAGPTSDFGFPTTRETAVTGGSYNLFAGTACSQSPYAGSGSGIFNNTDYGKVSEVHGCIFQMYKKGMPDSPGGTMATSGFGMPTSDEVKITGGAVSTFAGSSCGAGPVAERGSGSAIYWNASVGQPYEIHGCLYHNYLARGGSGALGLLTSSENKVSGGYYNLVAGSSCGSASGSGLYWYSAGSVAHLVYGCIYQAYRDYGGPTSQLGFPLSEEYASGSGRKQDFQCGSITWIGGAANILLTCSSTNYIAPTVTALESNTTNCPGTQQYFDDTDTNGVPISWTYANGSHQCIRVLWTPPTQAGSCTYSFYVPSGFATATIQFFVVYLVNGDIPKTRTVTLNESPVSGYQTLFTQSGVVSVQFGDNNGQVYPIQIGWGSKPAHSLRQVC